ncbi:hypothetical protein BN1708_015091 [Verticillium longisporum]|uniref:Uncharacterized protein n=1 Tax=Verticillium longisporum TaxID=100787 RepID=A0A0G4M1A0_VERLO|nr:hypothetical protein BN1708_015091 [Verticillium longisporum]
MSADMHIAPDPGSSASPPAGAGGPNSLPVSLDHPAEEHDAPGPTKPSQPVATLPPPYTAADVPSQTTGAVAGSSDQVSPQPQDAPTKTQTTFLAQVGRWFEAHKFAASCIALFVAFAGLLVAIISVFPSFKSQYLSEEALELSRWTAFKDYIQVCSELVEAGTATPECEKAAHALLPPPPQMNERSLGPYERLRRRFNRPSLVKWADYDAFPIFPMSSSNPQLGPSVSVVLTFAGAVCYFLIVYKIIHLMIRLRRLRQGKYYGKCSNTDPRSILANPDYAPVRSEQAGLRTGYSYRTATRLFRRSYHPELA